jgi:hypothetical protein
MVKKHTPIKETPLFLTQADCLRIFVPIIQSIGKIHHKTTQVTAYPAKGGEVIITNTSTGYETKNKARKGDYIVTNKTKASEQYIVSAKKFPVRYKEIKKLKDGKSIYQAIGSVKGIKLTKVLLLKLNLPDHFEIKAVWKEKQVVLKSDFIVCPLDESEIYRIALAEFLETYK